MILLMWISLCDLVGQCLARKVSLIPVRQVVTVAKLKTLIIVRAGMGRESGFTNCAGRTYLEELTDTFNAFADGGKLDLVDAHEVRHHQENGILV